MEVNERLLGEERPRAGPKVGLVMALGLTVVATVGAIALINSNQATVTSMDDDEPYPLAQAQWLEGEEVMCFDGAPPVYYLREAQSEENKDKWLIRFRGNPGGDLCVDEPSCDLLYQQTANLVMAETTPIDTDGGLLNAQQDENPYFWDWNQVQTHYCTADVWMGNDSEEDHTDLVDYRFTGSHNMRQIITELIQDHGLSEASTVLLVGTDNSMLIPVHGNWIKQAITEASPDANVYAFFDSSFFVPMEYEPDQDFRTLMDLIGDAMPMWRGVLDESCTLSEEGATACLLGPAVAQFLDFPAFVSLAQQDTQALTYYFSPNQRATKEYRDLYVETITQLLQELPEGWAAFSSTCDTHITSDKWALQRTVVQGVSLDAALHEFVSGNNPGQLIQDADEQCSLQTANFREVGN